MLLKRKRRLYMIISLLFGVSTAVALTLYALKKNINLYFIPQQVFAKSVPAGRLFRLGGMVVKGSVYHAANNLQVSFKLSDFHRNITVHYEGILPALFHEGQGIVAQGKLNSQGIFIANQVLAKHDANYRPPSIINPNKSRT